MFSPETLRRLVAILDAERDVNRPLVIGSYTRVPILVTGTIGRGQPVRREPRSSTAHRPR